MLARRYRTTAQKLQLLTSKSIIFVQKVLFSLRFHIWYIRSGFTSKAASRQEVKKVLTHYYFVLFHSRNFVLLESRHSASHKVDKTRKYKLACRVAADSRISSERLCQVKLRNELLEMPLLPENSRRAAAGEEEPATPHTFEEIPDRVSRKW